MPCYTVPFVIEQIPFLSRFILNVALGASFRFALIFLSVFRIAAKLRKVGCGVCLICLKSAVFMRLKSGARQLKKIARVIFEN